MSDCVESEVGFFERGPSLARPGRVPGLARFGLAKTNPISGNDYARDRAQFLYSTAAAPGLSILMHSWRASPVPA